MHPISPLKRDFTPPIFQHWIAFPKKEIKTSMFITEYPSGFFSEIQKEATWILAHFPKIEVPLLLMQGRDDRIMDVTTTSKLYEGSPGRVIYREWKHAGHQLHHSELSSDVMDFIIDWIKDGI